MSDVESVKALLQSIQQIIENNDKEDRANGDLFNFFEVCKIHTKEIRHSMFIAELLNPKGSHGQGDMFLREFLAVLGAKENAPDEEILSRFCSEKTTVWTEFRSIDISLYTDSDVIIIENKINALTRPGQLFDYVNKWKDGDWKKNVRAVVYLTPNGREPEKDSLVPSPQRAIDNDTEIDPKPLLVCMSYQADIIEWLERCLRNLEEEKQNLRFNLSQYVNCIREITHQGRNKAMSDEIKNVILSSEDYFEAAQKVSSELKQYEARNVWLVGKHGKDAGYDNGQFYKVPIGDSGHEFYIFEDMALGIKNCKVKDENKPIDRKRLILNSREIFDCDVDLVNIASSDKFQNWEWYVEPSEFLIAKLFLSGFPKNLDDVVKRLAAKSLLT